MSSMLRRVVILSGKSSNRHNNCTGGETFRKCVKYYSSEVATKQAVEESKDSSASPSVTRKLDPFGIEDVTGDLKSSVLVQGFYEQNKQKQISVEAAEEGDEPFKKYDGWLRAREAATVKERSLSGVETFRSASFGGIRLDSDNIVDKDGQFDDNVPNSGGGGERQRYPRNLEKRENRGTNMDAPFPQSMLASDFIKKIRHDTREKTKIQNEPHKTIERPIVPRQVQMTNLDEEKERFAKLLGPDALDSNHIPKTYQLPPYNKLTQEEMWTYLKHTLIFQNEYIFAINKPSGVPIHSPSIDCRHFITQFLSRFAALVNVDHIYALHRLDKETSGVLMFAKDPRIAKFITEKFAQRQIDKKYLTITKSCPRIQQGTIKIPIGQGKVGGTDKFRAVLKPDLNDYKIQSRQQQCREAITHFNVLRSIQEAAFLEVSLETGVQHQIRVHLGLGLGCPIIGDHKYSHRDKMAPQRLHPHLLHLIKVKQSKVRELPLHLHCNSISFTLPEGATDSKEPVYVHAHVPHFFQSTLRAFGLK